MKNGVRTGSKVDGYIWRNEDGGWHRTDGPAAYGNGGGGRSWWVNDKLHRIDGPAIEHGDGLEYWYINGKCLSESEVLIMKEGLEFDKMMREMLTEPEAV